MEGAVRDFLRIPKKVKDKLTKSAGARARYPSTETDHDSLPLTLNSVKKRVDYSKGLF
ncbi:hypothetical protein GCM10022278_38070 [Allohahella marinimesophila]|uniref:Uncharacterized protein n=1 Tax=Allohahella marinimesophila TaxID=1054972 RepID=A0ABP7Q776_9GAMM